MQPQLMKERMPYVRFESKALERIGADGKKEYRPVIYAVITPVGTKDVVVREVNDWLANQRQLVDMQRLDPEWYEKYEKMYKMWQDTQTIPLEGTPIANWPVLTQAQATICRAINVHTVEDLAAANAETLGRIGMGAVALQQKARDWMTAQEGTGPLVEQMAAMRVKLADLEKSNKDLAQANVLLQAAVRAPLPGAVPVQDSFGQSQGKSNLQEAAAAIGARADADFDKILD